jgi:cytochrome c oxidase cbb3-type subunit 3
MSPEERRAHDALVVLDQRARELIAADRVNEAMLVELMADPDLMHAGEAVFRRDCAVCHGDHGEGDIGPNLTDEFWLHGPQLTDMYDIVRLGRPTHGMRAWEGKLRPAELLAVTAYAASLLGSDPANGKEPQGKTAVRKPPQLQEPGQSTDPTERSVTRD